MRKVLLTLSLVFILAAVPSQSQNLWNSWEIQGTVTGTIKTTELVGICVDVGDDQDFCFSVVESPPFWDHTGETWRYYRNFVEIGDCVYAAGNHQPRTLFYSGEENPAYKAFHKMHPGYCQ